MIDVSQESEAGFTLLEVIVAFIILSLSLIAVNRSVALAIAQIRRADEVGRAEELAQEVWANILLHRDGIPKQAYGGSQFGLRWELSADTITSNGKTPITQANLVIFSNSGRYVRAYTTFLSTTMAEE